MVEAQRSVAAELDRIAAGDRPPRPAVRRGRPSAGAGGRVGARRAARPAATRPRLHHVGAPRADRAAAHGLGRRGLGHRPGLRHDRRPQGRATRSRSRRTAPSRTTRARASRRSPTATPSPATSAGATSRSTRWRCGCRTGSSSTRTAAWWTWRTGVLRTPGTPGGLLLRRPAADDAGRALRRAAGVRGRPRGGRRDDRDGRPDRHRLGRAGPRRAGQAGLRAGPAARAGAPRRDRPGRPRAPRAAAAAPGDRRAPPPQGRLRAHADRARAGDRPRGRPAGAGPDFVLRFAALMHDVGKPRTRRFEADGRVTFHHHEVVGAKITRKRMQALRFSTDETDAVVELVALHLRFHGYGDRRVDRLRGAPLRARRRRPLLDRLHMLTRADCTTRNRRKAAALGATYDHLEERIARLVRGGGARRDPARPRRAPRSCAPRHPAGREWARPTGTCSSCGSIAARSPRTAEAELRAWWAARQSG